MGLVYQFEVQIIAKEALGEVRADPFQDSNGRDQFIRGVTSLLILLVGQSELGSLSLEHLVDRWAVGEESVLVPTPHQREELTGQAMTAGILLHREVGALCQHTLLLVDQLGGQGGPVGQGLQQVSPEGV